MDCGVYIEYILGCEMVYRGQPMRPHPISILCLLCFFLWSPSRVLHFRLRAVFVGLVCMSQVILKSW